MAATSLDLPYELRAAVCRLLLGEDDLKMKSARCLEGPMAEQETKPVIAPKYLGTAGKPTDPRLAWICSRQACFAAATMEQLDHLAKTRVLDAFASSSSDEGYQFHLGSAHYLRRNQGMIIKRLVDDFSALRAVRLSTYVVVHMFNEPAKSADMFRSRDTVLEFYQCERWEGDKQACVGALINSQNLATELICHVQPRSSIFRHMLSSKAHFEIVFEFSIYSWKKPYDDVLPRVSSQNSRYTNELHKAQLNYQARTLQLTPLNRPGQVFCIPQNEPESQG